MAPRRSAPLGGPTARARRRVAAATTAQHLWARPAEGGADATLGGAASRLPGAHRAVLFPGVCAQGPSPEAVTGGFWMLVLTGFGRSL